MPAPTCTHLQPHSGSSPKFLPMAQPYALFSLFFSLSVCFPPLFLFLSFFLAFFCNNLSKLISLIKYSMTND